YRGSAAPGPHPTSPLRQQRPPWGRPMHSRYRARTSRSPACPSSRCSCVAPIFQHKAIQASAGLYVNGESAHRLPTTGPEGAVNTPLWRAKIDSPDAQEEFMANNTVSRFFGGSPLMALVRVILLSILVGVILSAFGLDPWNIIPSLKRF